MNTNKNYGILNVMNELEYAPMSFKENGGIIINPSKEYYLSKGFYVIIDEKPEIKPNCYLKFNGYLKNEENKTITFDYVQIMIPVIRESRIYSKLKLEMVMFNIGKSFEFDQFIDCTMLSNDLGQEVPLRKFYDQANELKSDNEYFETYLKIGKEKLNISDEQANQILSACIADN